MKRPFILFNLFFIIFIANLQAQKQKGNMSYRKRSQKKCWIQFLPKMKKIFYDRIVTADTSLKREQLFIRIRQWFVENFTDSKNVLEVNDQANGLLTGKGTYKYSIISGITTHSGYATFVINVSVKDAKFRYQLYDFYANDQSSSLFVSPGQTYNAAINLDDIYAKYIKNNTILMQRSIYMT